MSTHDLPTIDVREAARRLEAVEGTPTPLLVDVREDDEFAALRVPGAVLLPISRFTQGVESLPRDRPLLMLCKSGGRSGMATDFLLRSGFGEVLNVSGGILAWQSAALPTRSGPVEPGEGELTQADQSGGPTTPPADRSGT